MPRTKIIEKPKRAAVKSSKKTEIIITEKPAAAAKIASALGDATQKNLNGVSYYEINKPDKKIIIGCAVGHLFTLKQSEGQKGWPIFNINWVPNSEVKKQDWSRKYYQTLSKLCKQADEFILATDYDIEGEVIGWNVLRFLCKKDSDKHAKRMKFSTLTSTELKDSYEHLMKNIDFGQAYAGETRHKLDWLYGINLSRALMEAIKTTGAFKIMSVGRVQGPTLHLIVEKEKEIQKFKPEPFWQIFLLVQDLNKQKVEVKYPKDITKKTELAKFKTLKGKQANATTIDSQQKIPPPAPFDLTTLQTEIYAFHKITPSRTLQAAQGLYLAGLISYPRTSSQKLPPSIAYKDILKKLGEHTKLTNYATRAKPVEGKKSDPAHPSIYPTGEFKTLSGEEKKVYELILKRFISCFCEDAIVDNRKIEVLVDSLKFIAKGQNIQEKGWMNVYPAKLQERALPKINGPVDIKEIRTEERQTQPPRRYSPASIVREMEKRNLGTKATRSSILETLYDRGYIKEKSIQATLLGVSLIDSLKKNSPIIIDEALTREFEKQMQSLQESKKDLDKKSEKVLENAKSNLLQIEKHFRKNEKKIGKELMGSIQEIRKEERENNLLQKCPKCGEGFLRILYNRASKRYFVACNAYPKCRTTFSLPPNSLIKPAKIKIEVSGENTKTEENKSEEQQEICKECGFPLMLAIRKAKRPWKFCFNPDCPTNKEWREKAEKAKEKKEQLLKEEETDKNIQS